MPTSGQYISTYKGLPLEEVEKLGASLEEKYYKGLADYSALQTMMAQQEIRDEDRQMHDQITGEISGSLQDIADKGNFEQANAQISLLATKYAGDKRVAAMMQNQAKAKEAQDLINKMKAEGRSPLIFSGPGDWGQTVDPETGESRTFNYDIEAMQDYDRRKSMIWDQLKANTENIPPQQMKGIMEGYIRTGKISGITDERVRDALESSLADYMDTTEYDQEFRKGVSEAIRSGMSEEDAKASVQESIKNDMLQKGLMRVSENVQENYMYDKAYEARLKHAQEQQEINHAVNVGFVGDFVGFQGSTNTVGSKKIAEMLNLEEGDMDGSYRMVGSEMRMNLSDAYQSEIDNKHGQGTTSNLKGLTSQNIDMGEAKTSMEKYQQELADPELQSAYPAVYAQIQSAAANAEQNYQAKANDYYKGYSKQLMSMGWDGIINYNGAPTHVNDIPQEDFVNVMETFKESPASSVPAGSSSWAKAIGSYSDALNTYEANQDIADANIDAENAVNYILRDLPSVDIRFKTNDNVERIVDENTGDVITGIHYLAYVPESQLEKEQRKMLKKAGHKPKKVHAGYDNKGNELTREVYELPGIMKKNYAEQLPLSEQERYNREVFQGKDIGSAEQRQRAGNLQNEMNYYKQITHNFNNIRANPALMNPDNITEGNFQALAKKYNSGQQLNAAEFGVLYLYDMKHNDPNRYREYNKTTKHGEKANILSSYQKENPL